MKFRFLVALLLLGAIVYYIGIPSPPAWAGQAVRGIQDKAKDVQLPKFPISATGDIEVHFCAVDDCVTPLSNLINKSNTTDCALYDVTIPGIVRPLQEKTAAGTARLVVDLTATKTDHNLDFAKRGGTKGLMHDKFCIFDHQAIMAGSFNPTASGAHSFDNNLLIIHSSALAENYEAEFEELLAGKFSGGGSTPHPSTTIGQTPTENFFCPEDWCANAVLHAIHPAQHTIDFLTFSFTHDGIGDALVQKHQDGVQIRGVMEKSQHNAYDEYSKLHDTGIDVRWDGNSGLMHHKVFIIDGNTVVTGSFNPTKNADTDNDENVLIIHDTALAAKYEQEFTRVYAAAQQS